MRPGDYEDYSKSMSGLQLANCPPEADVQQYSLTEEFQKYGLHIMALYKNMGYDDREVPFRFYRDGKGREREFAQEIVRELQKTMYGMTHAMFQVMADLEKKDESFIDLQHAQTSLDILSQIKMDISADQTSSEVKKEVPSEDEAAKDDDAADLNDDDDSKWRSPWEEMAGEKPSEQEPTHMEDVK